MNWNPHTERPDRAPTSVLIACTDDSPGYFLLPDLYTWDGSAFRNQLTGIAPRPEVFWWIDEDEVLQGLPE